MATKSKSTRLPPKPLRPSSAPSRSVATKKPSSLPVVLQPVGPIPWQPADYQVEAAKFLVERAAAGLFLDPGLRKTSIVLAALRALKRKGMMTAAIVVAPPRVAVSTWPEEIAGWKEFCHLKVAVLEGSDKEKLLDSGADIFCISWNLLPWLFDVTKTVSEKTKKVTVKCGRGKLDRTGANILVLDELGRARNPNSITFKVLKDVRDWFDRVYGMNGFPTPRSLMDLWAQMYAIDGGYSLGPYITHYRAAYFYPSGFGGYDYKLQDGAADRIYERIAPFAFRLEPGEYIKLPRLVENVIKVDLPPAARKAYDELEEDFFTEVDEIGITAVSGGVARGKCQQVANGGLYKAVEVDEDGIPTKGKREWFPMHDEKTQVVLDMVEELQGQPLLVVYHYGHDLERLQKALPKDTPVFGGGLSKAKGEALQAAWNRNEIPVMLCHAASMSHGLNMQKGGACHVMWHSLTDDAEAYYQLVRRLMRSGSTAPVVFSHLVVARDTVDEITLKRSQKKGLTSKQLSDALIEYTLKRRRKSRKR